VLGRDLEERRAEVLGNERRRGGQERRERVDELRRFLLVGEIVIS
jgi:hypothetical protein